MPRTLSKSKIIVGLICPKQLYLKVHHPELAEESEDAEARMQTGHEVGALACAAFPDGILIEHGDDPGQALSDTHALLRRAGDLTLFEPAFSADGVFFRADILRRIGDNWHLIEVKSSTSVKEYHHWDVATQLWVLDRLGIRPARVELAHIDRDFVYPGDGDYRGLFHFTDLKDEVAPLMGQVSGWVASFQAVLAGEEPDCAVGRHCFEPYACPFHDHCDPPEGRAEYPVTLLPYGGKTVASLVERGYRDLREVPADMLGSSRHLLIHHATVSGKPYFSGEAARLMEEFNWPRYYLDFETIQFAVPIWPGTRPYQQLPFQWSCHVGQADGRVEHREFLDLSGESPLRAFAESLLAAIPDDGGTILGYNVGFEKSIISTLAERFPDLAPGLHRLAGRCADLLAIARQHYYHPAMQGSWSLKAVLPTVAPELDYADLDVQHGMMAQEAYLEAIHPDTLPARREVLRRGLLAYCDRDTLALVRLAAFLGGEPG
jgi:hypothetical protein